MTQQYVAVNSGLRPSKDSGQIHPFLTRSQDGIELPVHAEAGDCDGRALGILAGLGTLIPKPAALVTTPFHE